MEVSVHANKDESRNEEFAIINLDYQTNMHVASGIADIRARPPAVQITYSCAATDSPTVWLIGETLFEISFTDAAYD